MINKWIMDILLLLCILELVLVPLFLHSIIHLTFLRLDGTLMTLGIPLLKAEVILKGDHQEDLQWIRTIKDHLVNLVHQEESSMAPEILDLEGVETLIIKIITEAE